MYGNIPPFSSFGGGGGYGITGSPSAGWTMRNQLTIQRNTPDAGAETWLDLTDLADAAVGVTFLTSLSTNFRPLLRCTVAGTGGSALEIRGRAVTDGGTVAAIALDGRTSVDGALTVKPLFSFRNNATEVASVSAKGAWTYTVMKTDALAEVLATWALDEDTVSNLNAVNSDTNNVTCMPGLLGLGGGSNRRGLTVMGRGATDSGAIALLTLDGSIGATKAGLSGAAAATSRPVIKFTNNGTEMAQFTAAGSLALSNPITHAQYTVATLPSAAIAGQEVYVSDAAVAPCLAFSNGTVWKRCDNAATTVV